MIGDEHHGHARHTGLPWLDLVLAGSAVVVSVVSLVVSIGHGRTMEKLVETNALQVRASTLPILRFGHGNLDVRTGAPRVHLDLANGGTGPAVIQWLVLRLGDRVVGDPKQLLDACCRSRPGQDGGMTYNNLATGQTLPAGQSNELFALAHPAGDPAVWDAMEQHGRSEVRAQACYCSVLDECWISDFGRTPARQVKTCGAPPPGAW